MGGETVESNLWLACRRCNEAKAAQIAAVDDETGLSVQLFNPRTQPWSGHFSWSGDGTRMVGLTASGRATIAALKLNHPDIVAARLLWVAVGWHPPD